MPVVAADHLLIGGHDMNSMSAWPTDATSSRSRPVSVAAQRTFEHSIAVATAGTCGGAAAMPAPLLPLVSRWSNAGGGMIAPAGSVPNPVPSPVPGPTPMPLPTPAPSPMPHPAPSPLPDPAPAPTPTPTPETLPGPVPPPVPDPAPEPQPPIPTPGPSPEPLPDPWPAPQPPVG